MDTRHVLMNNKLTEDNINIVSEILLFNFKLTFHHYVNHFHYPSHRPVGLRLQKFQF